MLAATLPYYVRTVRHDPSQLIQPHHNIENEALRLGLTLLLGRLLEMGSCGRWVYRIMRRLAQRFSEHFILFSAHT